MRFDMKSQPWLWLGLLTLVSCLTHLLVDLKVGIYGGTSTVLVSWDGLNALLNATLYALWTYTLVAGSHGDKSAL